MVREPNSNRSNAEIYCINYQGEKTFWNRSLTLLSEFSCHTSSRVFLSPSLLCLPGQLGGGGGGGAHFEYINRNPIILIRRGKWKESLFQLIGFLLSPSSKEKRTGIEGRKSLNLKCWDRSNDEIHTFTQPLGSLHCLYSSYYLSASCVSHMCSCWEKTVTVLHSLTELRWVHLSFKSGYYYYPNVIIVST